VWGFIETLLILTKLLSSLILILSSLLDSSKTSGSTGGDKTDLSTGWTFTSDCGRHTNVLMVTSSVGMLYGILSYTTNLWPAVSLHGVLVVCTSGLQQGLVGTSTSGDDSDLGTDGGGDRLLTSRRKSKLRGSLVFVVGDNDGVGTGATSKGTTVSALGFDVADNGSLGNRSQGKDISTGKAGLLSAVDELSAVHTLGTDEQFIVALVSVLIQELNTTNGSTSTGVVHDLLDDSSDVTLLLGIVERSELASTLSRACVRTEDGGLTLSLCLDVLSHLVLLRCNRILMLRSTVKDQIN